MSPSPATDPSLVDWPRAIAEHNRRVVVSLLALGLPLDQAEDVAHQAWMRLMDQHRSGRLPEIKLPGLAIRQARFLGLNLSSIDRKAARALRPLDEAAEVASEAPDPVASLAARRELERVRRVLATCSASAQAVFRELFADPAPSYAEIARRLDLSVQRVRQIVCEVRGTLRQVVELEP